MKILNRLFLVTGIVGFFMGCETTVQEISELAQQEDSLSVELATDVAVTYTDSGLLKAKIYAPLMRHYPDASSPYMEMDSGVNAEFFTKDGLKQSWLSAGYAISYEKTNVIILRKDVVVSTIKDEVISSEELIWDQKKKKIRSNKDVKIRIKDEKILYGKGFESNEDFSWYRIVNLKGIIRLGDESKEDR